MVPRSTIAGIAVVLVAAWGVTMPARQEAPRVDPRVTALIASLGTRYWDKAVDDLVAIGDPAVAPLLAELRTGKSAGRAHIPLALARIGTAPALDAVFEALTSPVPAIREGAVTALGSVRSERSVTALIGVVTKETGQARRAAAAALGALGDPRAAEALARVLTDPAWYIREEAARALGRIQSASSVDPLVAALADANGLVRQAARSALAAQGDVAVPAVAAALDAPVDVVRWQAAWVLGHVDAPAVVEPLLRALESGDTMVRVEAAVGLARIGRRSSRNAVAKALGRLLTSPDSALREEAAWVLSELRSPGAAAPLAAAQPAGADPAAVRCAPPRSRAVIAPGALVHEDRTYRLYPETLDAPPDIPSPLTAADGTELMVAMTGTSRYAIVPVTLKSKSRQCDAASGDFPAFAATGLHSEAELGRTHTITGRSVAEITELARPGRLSDAGFLGSDEDVVSVLKADNRIVRALGLTHPDLARPLFHVLNVMQTDIDLGRWNVAEHRWGNITAVFSRGRTVALVAGDTKGAQASIFADGIEGSYWIEISREPTDTEYAFLKARYGHLGAGGMVALVNALTRIRTGEIQPHYVTWYGFYEGKTPWRTDPITIAFVFGLRTLEQIEAAFPGRLYDVMMSRFTRGPSSTAARLDRLLSEAYPDDQPGAAVFVSKRGTTILERGYGLADTERRTPVSPDTVFRLASVTKAFTGTAILMLAGRGALSLDDPVTKFLPSYPASGQAITVGHLLSHTSGLADYLDRPDSMAWAARDHTVSALIDAFKDRPAAFSPGEKNAYSNSNYILLGATIERVSGVSFAAFVDAELFTPLGMTSSSCGGAWSEVSRLAMPYEPARTAADQLDWSRLLVARPYTMSALYAAGGCVSSARDLARFHRALSAGSVIGTPLLTMSYAPARLVDRSADTMSAGGWQLDQVAGRRAAMRGGALPGVCTWLLTVPDEDLGVILLSNRTPGKPRCGLLAVQMAGIALER